MAETWTTSRQCITISESAFNFDTDRAAVAVAAERTYIEAKAITAGYLFVAQGCWAICTGYDPEKVDILCTLNSILHSESTRLCTCTNDTNVVYCCTTGVDDNGPVVLEYPKYYQNSTVPPNFDVNFRIYSSAPINWNSFVLVITSSQGSNKSYSNSDITVVDITNEIKEVRLVPSDNISLVGDTINVRVYLKDIYNRELTLNW